MVEDIKDCKRLKDLIEYLEDAEGDFITVLTALTTRIQLLEEQVAEMQQGEIEDIIYN